MPPPHEDQIVLLLSDPSYGFDNRGPRYHISHAGSYSRETLVDPAPCYAHNIELVRSELDHLRTVAPLPIPLAIFVLCHEDLGRVNGWCEESYKYVGDDHQSIAIITLNGKRIPPHPAMTRYLVSHEYGHAINNHVVRKRAVKDSEFDAMYIERFRPKANLGYGCGKWHSNVGEMIANDFRILIAKRELEFWPHEGHPRPEEIPNLTEFWNEVQTELQTGG